MSLFGCHSCGVDLSQYASYEDSPCATCRMAKEYTSTHRAALFDSSGDLDEDESLATIVEFNTAEERKAEKTRLLHEQLRSIETLRKSIEDHIFIVVSGIILKMVKLAKYNPVMFEVVIKKLQYPHMSYSEIGNSMTPHCSKQNVLYHLKHAVKMFPELSKALLTDTRFSAGRYALQSIANKKRKDHCIERMRGILYGDVDPDFKATCIDEINKIIAAPFMASDEALNFNPYIDDEKEDC